MNYEQKYKEALEKARSLCAMPTDKAMLEEIFPELIESEDEKMLNQLHSWMQEFGGAEEYTEKVYSWLKGLLEKQGKSIDKFIDKLVKYRECLISKTEQWTKRENNKTNNNADKYYCIGAANALISARAEFEETFDYESLFEKQGENNMDISEATKQKLEDNLNKALEKETSEFWNESLEKQGEQNHTDKVGPKFHAGDFITDGKRIFQIKETIWERNNRNDGTTYCESLIVNLRDGNTYANNTDLKEYHLWTIQDAKDGDILTDKQNCTCIFREIMTDDVEESSIDAYCGINIYDKFVANEKGEVWTVPEDLFPATKEQRDLLFQKMHEAGYEWDAVKKELRKIEQKPAWSEEEFAHIVGCLVQDIVANEHVSEGEKQPTKFFVEKYYNKLRPQNRWKPSRQNIKDLEWCADLVQDKMGVGFHRLQVFIDEIKKL